MSKLRQLRSVLFLHFNNILEHSIREEFNVPPETPVIIDWADDGSCIINPEEVFSYLGYDDVKKLIRSRIWQASPTIRPPSL